MRTSTIQVRTSSQDQIQLTGTWFIKYAQHTQSQRIYHALKLRTNSNCDVTQYPRESRPNPGCPRELAGSELLSNAILCRFLRTVRHKNGGITHRGQPDTETTFSKACVPEGIMHVDIPGETNVPRPSACMHLQLSAYHRLRKTAQLYHLWTDGKADRQEPESTTYGYMVAFEASSD